MQKLKYSLIVVISIISCSLAQSAYELTPGSERNLFELSLVNQTYEEYQSIKIYVEDAPEWIQFNQKEIFFDRVTKSQKQTVHFFFNVGPNVKPGDEHIIKFRITDNIGRSWLKKYNVKVALPKVFSVNQNYPNPFNPSTTIKYSIPQDAFVNISVYNVLGEKVTELLKNDIKAGVYEIVFDASLVSSGFYFYVVEAKGKDGTKYFDSKKMILLK